MTPTKIGFVLLSNSRNPMPSTRIAVLNMLPFLRVAGFDPHIVFEPNLPTEKPDVSELAPRLIADGFQIVIFQKVHGPSVETLARQLSAAGIKTLYSVCDLVNIAMVAATDATAAVTDYLKSQYPQSLQAKMNTVHDGIENQDIQKTDWSRHSGSRWRPLRAVLVTSARLDRLPLIGTPPGWLEVNIVGRYPPRDQIFQRVREARWRYARQKGIRGRLDYLGFLSNRRIKCDAWDPVGVYDIMQKADIGIIAVEPTPEHTPGMPPPSWKIKSENRLTMKMCVGLPVVASPIPAYEPVIEQGVNGFLAETTSDWWRSLETLRDPKIRQAIGEQARKSVLQKYSMQEQSRRLVAVLRQLVPEPHVESIGES